MNSFAVDTENDSKEPLQTDHLEKKTDNEPTRATWMKKLFTNEDPQNIHKTCGVFVLLHFAFRYYQMLFGDISAGFGRNAGKGTTVTPFLCLLPHALLSISSLIFHSVPRERVVGLPMIWQEFRVHSIIFALRSIVATACGWISVYFNHDPIIRKATVALSSASILISIYFADEATKKLCPSSPESTTATMPYWQDCSLSTQRRFKSFYAYCQFLATLACLSMTNPAWPFAVLLPIQLAAFLMTMVRKGFLTSKGYHVLYTASLIMPFIVAIRRMYQTRHPDVMALFFAGLALYRLRSMGIDKYYLWVPLVLFRVWLGDKYIVYDRY